MPSSSVIARAMARIAAPVMPSWNGSWALPVVFDMFQDIEQARGRNAVREETGCLQGAAHYLPDAPTPGIANPVRPRLQEHNLQFRHLAELWPQSHYRRRCRIAGIAAGTLASPAEGRRSDVRTRAIHLRWRSTFDCPVPDKRYRHRAMGNPRNPPCSSGDFGLWMAGRSWMGI